jgi:hypothetical protein
MRWKPVLDGDVRVIKKFIIFPTTLLNRKTNESETRWLELTKIKQVYKSYTDDDGWEHLEWIDD